MAVPIQSPVPAQHALPTVWLERAAIALFIAALSVAAFPTPPMGPSPFGFTAWGLVIIVGFALSAGAAIASQQRGHRVARTPLGYSALAFLAATLGLLAAAVASMTGQANPEVFLMGMTVTGIVAAVLGTLAVFHASGAAIRFLPSTPSGWWASAFLAASVIIQFTPWIVLTPATIMAAPALALSGIVSYRERSVLSAVALVAAPGVLAFFALLTLIGPFTVLAGG